MKTIRRNAKTLTQARRDDTPAQRTVAGTVIPPRRSDQTRKYGKMKYTGEDPHLALSINSPKHLASWGKATGKAGRHNTRGTAHCAAGNWVLAHREYSEPQCLLVPNAVPERPARVKYNYKTMTAARAMLIATQGQPPEGATMVGHKCGNGHLSCINPAHLYWATAKSNARDKVLHDPATPPIEVDEATQDEIRTAPITAHVAAWQFGVPISQVQSIRKQ